MGSSSGLIIAFVVVVWAAYFIPLALRRYDEASKNASVESTGGLSRVISRTSRSPQTPKQNQTRSTPQPQAQTPAPSVVEAVEPQAERIPVRTPDRPAARLAARRRRRTLLTLIAMTAIVGGLAGFSVIAPYWVAAPVALVVAWLAACRIQVRRERGIVRAERSRPKLSFPKLPKLPKAPARDKPTRTKTSRPSLAKLVRPAPAKATAADEEETIIVSGQFEDIDPGRKHEMEDVPLAVDALDDQIVIAVPSISTAGEALWDPLPVTLPTYVTKPRAGRTVRTIDFSQPNTWTSGHIEGEDVELPTRSDDTGEHRRAVGH